MPIDDFPVDRVSTQVNRADVIQREINEAEREYHDADTELYFIAHIDFQSRCVCRIRPSASA
jgi:hypothetical protein